MKYADMTAYYTATGRIAVNWAFLEAYVNRFIWELMDVEQFVGACLTAQIIAPSNRFRALIALVKYRGGSERHVSKLNKLAARVDTLSRQRNRFVHDPAVADLEGNFFRLEITADKSLTFGAQPIDLAKLKIFADEIKGTAQRFWDLAEEIRLELPASPNIRFGQSPGIDLSRPPDPGSAD